MIQGFVGGIFQNPLERHKTFQSFVKIAKDLYDDYNVLEYLRIF